MKKTVIIGTLVGLVGGFVAVMILKTMDVELSPGVIGGAVGGSVGAVVASMGSRTGSSSR